VREPAPLHPVSRLHLDILTGELGILQHAVGPRPDPAHGSCTDDVARALEVDLLHQRQLGWQAVAEGAERSLRFLDEAFDSATGRFRNFRATDGTWADEPGSEDCHGRAVLALGHVIAEAPNAPMVAAARALLARALPAARRLTALRAQSSVLLGSVLAVRTSPTSATVAAVRLAATTFHARFPVPGSVWPWPEPILTYENALPARALIVAGRWLGSAPMLATGIEVLDWLIAEQTEPDGHLSPIGNGWWPRGGTRSRFDQQPIEATALLLAAEAAHEATRDGRYLAAMERAYAWFLGANDLQLAVADPLRGAGGDGLTGNGVNANQGAESTLMWLIAAEHMRDARPIGPGPAARAAVAVGAT
jgi:hypothetical protein